MLSGFGDFVKTNDLITEDQKTILAISGGVDSIVMCHLFQQSGLNFGIAHANFQLRDQESELDQEMVNKLADTLKVPFWSETFDTKNVSSGHGISIQMAARDLRYSWLEDLRVTERYDRIAVAHHLDDCLETILLNLTKGTGVSGLRGIRAKSGNLIRPLLFTTKAAIVKYAKSQNLTWREDSSNKSVNYQRNLLRSKVVPVLNEINPNLFKSLINSMERMTATEELLIAAVNRLQLQAVKVKGSDLYIEKKALQEAAGGVVLLDQILKPLGFNYHQTRQIYQLLDSSPGKIFESTTHTLNIDRDCIIISPRTTAKFSTGLILREDRGYAQENLRLQIDIYDHRTYQMPSDELTASLDLDKLTFPLIVRPWQQGDRFIPLGMKGQKKLSDFMIDKKIPVNLKKRLFVLTSDQKIVWVIGWRIDDRYKVTVQTKNVFQVHYNPNNDQSF